MICTEVAPNSRTSVSRERHELLPTASDHHDRGRRVGADELRARLEIGHPDVAENLADVVEDLHGGRGSFTAGESALFAMSTIIRNANAGSWSKVRSSPSAIIPSSSSAARGPSSPP